MGSLFLLIPLYLTDVYSLSAARIGVYMTAHSLSLLVTITLGGKLADRWPNRWIIMFGGLSGGGVCLFFGLAGGDGTSAWVLAGLIGHGVSAGFYLASVHRTALAHVPKEEAGSTSGLYSMLRYSGALLGPAISGVLLYWLLSGSISPAAAYRRVFLMISPLGLVSGILAGRIRD